MLQILSIPSFYFQKCLDTFQISSSSSSFLIFLKLEIDFVYKNLICEMDFKSIRNEK